MRRCVSSGGGVGGGRCAVPAGLDLCLLRRDGPAVQLKSGGGSRQMRRVDAAQDDWDLTL